eukprot:CAMPEP_0177407614 /NCGR_PEP_ID=MMETSP0368-20130122/63213_1 /TAXON_ID=447022 ORGANISM="Scrippsiella hangoei-like, Strain SHHI-4" /NCGR_SAMPLE_ID=MMETSP0368 /ASSEMBLY_ACC=CAM_ASM_000363 /LENGTH=768 /DNA_ID=CAMNT_0018876145 /DNA_START=28 /DNA_END=2331 /DNA_ORIENTATION=-
MATDDEGGDLPALTSTAEACLDDDDAAQAVGPAIRALERCRAAGDRPRAVRLLLLAHLARGDVRGAVGDLGRKELDAAKKAGDKSAEATMLLALAETAGGQEPTEQLQRWAKDSIGLFKEIGDRKMYATALLALAGLRLKASRPEEAAKASSEATAIFRELGDKRGEAWALHAAAEAYAFDGLADEAVREARKALELLRQLGLRKAEAAELHAISRWLLLRGHAQEAIEVVNQALEILEEVYALADAREIAYWKTLVLAHTKANNTTSALRAARDGFDRCEDARDKSGEGNAHLLISAVQSNSGQFGKAIRSATKATYAFEDAGNQSGRGEALCVMSRIRGRLGLFDKALRDLEEALNAFEDLGDMLGQGRALQQRSEVFMGKKDMKSALRCAVEARELFQDTKDASGEAQALLQVSTAELAGGNFERAGRAAEEAKGLFAEMDDMVGEASAELMAMATQMRSEDYDAAVKTGKRALALYREFGDRLQDEVYTMMQISIAQIMSVVKKEQAGTATEKALQDGANKAKNYAKEAIAIANSSHDPRSKGFAQYGMGYVLGVTGPYPEAMIITVEAVGCFKECKDYQWEAAGFLLVANHHSVLSDQFGQARDLAEEVVWMAQQVSDGALEDEGWVMLDRINRARQAYEQRQQKAKMAQAIQSQIVPFAQQGTQEQAPQQQTSMSAPAAQVSQARLDLGKNLTPETVAALITDLALQMIGDDVELEKDMPLMEAGLTSNTAVMFRDAIKNSIPGLKLPVTLSFDYPSVGAIS